ncbi:MAG: Hsp20 family protein [Pseudomonadota bacterium]
MARVSFASHPFLLGFEQLDQLVERTAKAGDGYPPYNIELTGPDAYRITLAVAGFAEEDLQITVEDQHLVIRGKQKDLGDGREFLHRGIATRQFQKSFVLAERVEVLDATLDCGLLHVSLKRKVPEAVVQSIQINSGR